jgi:serine/threonine protein phosphatase PrpC
MSFRLGIGISITGTAATAAIIIISSFFLKIIPLNGFVLDPTATRKLRYQHRNVKISAALMRKECIPHSCLQLHSSSSSSSSPSPPQPASQELLSLFNIQNVQTASTCQGGIDPDRPTKVNQDAYFIKSPLLGSPSSSSSSSSVEHLHLIGVLDGHGKKGHELNSFLSRRLPVMIEDKIVKHFNTYNNNDEHEHGDDDDNTTTTKILDLEQILIQSYEQVNEEARINPNVPAGRSGTTCVTCILDTKHGIIYTANVGDSRAIFATTATATAATNIQTMSIETTTTKNKQERERIQICQKDEPGARIDSLGNVWYGPQGIAMTRSLGNVVMKRAGVLHTPIVSFTHLNHETIMRNKSDDVDGGGGRYDSLSGYIVLATDGIFDVLPNDLVMKIVHDNFTKHEDLKYAADVLVQEARDKWQDGLLLEVKVDDTTCVIVQFDVVE